MIVAHQRTGLNADTFKRLVVGPGAVYLDYDLGTERLLGATRGGNTFEPGVTIRDVEVDGVKGKVRGGRIIDRVEPVLRCNMIEFSVANLLAAIPGLVQESVSGTAQGEEWELDLGSATGGYYKLGDGKGNWSRQLDLEDDADAVKHELERLFGIGSVESVTGEGTPFTITFALSAKATGLVASLGTLTFPLTPDATLEQTEEYDPGDSYTKLTLAEISDEAYFTNCALVGRVSGTNQPVVVILKNVLGGGGFTMDFVANGEMVSELRLEGHFEPPGEGEYDPEFPFEIRWPTEA
ncbi:MAG TPA: hypothetical protein PLC08_06250 [Candidatus Bipolaricaulis sp.]|nr:hypothetical protein [Candidatus Bipolaricaulis sp.]